MNRIRPGSGRAAGPGKQDRKSDLKYERLLMSCDDMARKDIDYVREQVEGIGGLNMRMKVAQDTQKRHDAALTEAIKKIKALESFLGVKFDETPKYIKTE